MTSAGAKLFRLKCVSGRPLIKTVIIQSGKKSLAYKKFINSLNFFYGMVQNTTLAVLLNNISLINVI